MTEKKSTLWLSRFLVAIRHTFLVPFDVSVLLVQPSLFSLAVNIRNNDLLQVIIPLIRLGEQHNDQDILWLIDEAVSSMDKSLSLGFCFFS